MNSLVLQYTKQLERLIADDHIRTGNAPSLPSAQLVMPTIPWDWPPAPVGTMLNSATQLADTMPISSLTETYYQPSANVFSQNYRTYLSLVNGTSQPIKRLVKQARHKITVPSGNPANDPKPPGWSPEKVNGILRWCPAWVFSDTATDWQQKVHDGSIRNPGTVTIKLRKGASQQRLLVTKKLGSTVTVPLDADANFEKVVIEASAWGQISINPGSWYDSSIIALTSNELSPALRKKFFATTGLLASRVSSFYVAYKVKINFHGENFSQQDLNQDNQEIWAMGIQVKAVETKIPDCIQFIGSTPDPVIVAVAIEKMN